MTLEQILEIIERYKLRIPPTVYYELLADVRNEQESQTFKWCTDCREYDQEKHCCHRWSKVIRDTVEELKQEPFINKPCVSSAVCEHDKQKVLDKIRAKIMEIFNEEKDVEPMWALGLKYSTHIIDKYKAETEG